MKLSLFTRSTVLVAAGVMIGSTLTIAATSLGSDVFSDIKKGAYYDEAVGDLYEAGIIKGNPDGTYRPADSVSRADIAVMLDRLRDELKGTGGSTRSTRSRASTGNTDTSSAASSRMSYASSQASFTTAGAFRFTSGGYTVNENAGTATITISRAGGGRGAVAVNYTLTAGTATAGSDYTATNGTVSLEDGVTSKTFTVQILDDSTAESNETVTITLSNPTNTASLTNPYTATLTIVDNESSGNSSSRASAGTAQSSSTNSFGTLSFSATQYSADEAGGTLTVTVNRAGGTKGAVNVNYSTSNGTGTSGVDYTTTTGTLNFAEGDTTKTFTVPVVNDSSIEGSRTFNLTLAGATGGANLGTAAALVTILDDEAMEYGSGSIKLSKTTYEVTESAGTAVITVLRTGGSKGTATLTYEVIVGSAVPGLDYQATSGTMTFVQGEAAKTFSVPIFKDNETESDETANINIYNIQGANSGSPLSATLAIYN